MDFIRITFVDILDIVLVAMLMYYLYKVLRGTHAMSILSGILLLFVVYIVVRALNMELLTSLIGSLTSVGLIALVIIFQPEIRPRIHQPDSQCMRRYVCDENGSSDSDKDGG